MVVAGGIMFFRVVRLYHSFEHDISRVPWVNFSDLAQVSTWTRYWWSKVKVIVSDCSYGQLVLLHNCHKFYRCHEYKTCCDLGINEWYREWYQLIGKRYNPKHINQGSHQILSYLSYQISFLKFFRNASIKLFLTYSLSPPSHNTLISNFHPVLITLCLSFFFKCFVGTAFVSVLARNLIQMPNSNKQPITRESHPLKWKLT